MPRRPEGAGYLGVLFNFERVVALCGGWLRSVEVVEPPVVVEPFAVDGPVAMTRESSVRYRSATSSQRATPSRYSATMFLEDRIMNVSAALDSFDKVRRGTRDERVNYVDRIAQCIGLAGEEPFADLIAQDGREWAKAVKETRHDLAHHRERFRLNGSVGEHLQSEQLFWLFVLCMLRLADAQPAVFDGIAKHGQVRWLVEQARGGDD